MADHFYAEHESSQPEKAIVTCQELKKLPWKHT